MFAIEEIQKLQKFSVVKCTSRRDAFKKGIGVDYRYSDIPNFKNNISMNRMSQVEKFDTGESILTDEVLRYQIEQSRTAAAAAAADDVSSPKPDTPTPVIQ